MLMITKKTAAMLRLAGTIGAIIAGAGNEEVSAIGCYSENLGMAFQIQDDLLDVYSNEKEFGKRIGGDILENKKTYLYLKAMDIAKDQNAFRNLYSRNDKSKISEVVQYYNKSGVIDSAKNDVRKYTDKANSFLKSIKNEECLDLFKSFSDMLLNR